MKVIGYEDLYQLEDTGDIYSLRKSRKMRAIKNTNGYCYVGLKKNTTRKNQYIHRLIAEHFIPNPKGLPCVNHIDGDKINNHVSNLEWCTHSQNNKHAFDIGLRTLKGSNHSQNKLVDKQVIEIRERLANTSVTQRALAKEFGVHERTIGCIKDRKTWRHI